MWLTARAHGLGMGWVTLFEPADLADLLGLPDGVETLGWMCLGWPDERPPEPGLQRAAWSAKLALDDVVLAERWPETGEIDATARGPETVGVDGGPAAAFGPGAPASGLRPTEPPPSYLAGPEGARLVAASDDADGRLAQPFELEVEQPRRPLGQHLTSLPQACRVREVRSAIPGCRIAHDDEPPRL